jgi:hypothetical protein
LGCSSLARGRLTDVAHTPRLSQSMVVWAQSTFVTHDQLRIPHFSFRHTGRTRDLFPFRLLCG